MKNLILTTALSMILLTSCTVQDEILPESKLQEETHFILDQKNNTVSKAYFESTYSYAASRANILDYSSNTLYTSGYYTSSNRYQITINWEGKQKGSTAAGAAEIIYATPVSYAEIIMDTECITVIGNQAVYGGKVTKFQGSLPQVPRLQENWRIYFKVIDDEIIDNATYDQIANNIIFASPQSTSLCDVYLPDNEIWSMQGYDQVNEPGFVSVSQ